jgi:hypothetical protein
MKFLNRVFLGNCISALVLASGFSQVAQADVIPYANSGFYNPATYSFTATSTGNVTAYIVGGFGASYENQMGLLVNGILSSAGFGLDNHTSSLGDSFDLGPVNAGDILTFVMHNVLPGLGDLYSDPSMNVGYDYNGNGQNHIYSTTYTATSPTFPGVPVGTYVAFEDLQFPYSDYNYDDESFVFTNTTVHVPEPSTLILFGSVLLGLVWMRRRHVY